MAKAMISGLLSFERSQESEPFLQFATLREWRAKASSFDSDGLSRVISQVSRPALHASKLAATSGDCAQARIGHKLRQIICAKKYLFKPIFIVGPPLIVS